MTLSPGTKFGPYVVEAPAGVGGMGEVYKAKDTRLDRTVAIKILSTHVAANADVKLRFEREAKAISSLNHPNICTLYDIGQENGIDYLVMEYLDGETLSARLAKGALPLPELLLITSQIADALDKAHRKGLIHRDLKPGNIMLTKTGAKLMDFGLAKIQHDSNLVAGMSGITRTSMPLTGEGTIVGTLQYMSPEQLEGKEADIRSDIFAFGAIMYEMAVGKRAFEGTSQASIIAAILKENPRPISEIQPMSPPMLDRVIRQCLEKDPDHRWQSAGDLKRALQWITEGGSQVGIPIPVSVRRKSRERFLWIATAVFAIAAIALAVIHFTEKKQEPKIARFSIVPSKELNAVTWPRLSPDGTLLAFQARDSSGQRGIWVRPLNSLDARLLVTVASTENNRPFWSPDSKQLAFFDGKQLKKISLVGGTPQIICETEFGADGSWGSQGIILFDGRNGDSILQVPASGGTPTAATGINREEKETAAAWPWFLPDGIHFLYVGYIRAGEEYVLRIGSINSFESVKLMEIPSRVEYSNGYILYAKSNTLLAHPFDPDKLKIIGEPAPIASGVQNFLPRALFSAADDGTLIYQRGGNALDTKMLWVNRKGDSLGVEGTEAEYESFSFSRDGSQLAYDIALQDGIGVDSWIRDIKRQVSSRLTFGPKYNVWPLFTPDGNKIIFSKASTDNNAFSIMIRNANGTGSEEELLPAEGLGYGATDISPDGKNVLITSFRPDSVDLWLLSLVDKKTTVLLATPHDEYKAMFSPNGKYYLYASDETGSSEIFIREFGEQGGKWQLTTSGSRGAQWSPDGKEIIYATPPPEYGFWSVPVSYTNGFELGIPTKLFTRRFYYNGNTTLTPFRFSPDGQRLLVHVDVQTEQNYEFVLVQNWPEELKK